MPLTFRATNVPAWATFNTTTGALTGTPGEANVGMTGMITIEVSDSKAVAQLPRVPHPGEQQCHHAAAAANVAPTIAGTPGTTATVGTPYTFAPVGDDANDDALTFTIQNKPDLGYVHARDRPLSRHADHGQHRHAPATS